MNKYEFISELLEKEKFKPVQRERLVRLILNELKTDGISNNEIEERITQIEKKLGLKAIEDVFEDKNEQLPEYIDPVQLSEFLNAYNTNNLLKYTCHAIDEDGLNTLNEICGSEVFNLTLFQSKLASQFSQLSKKYNIPTKIWALINVYINGGREWSSDKVKINWKLNELLAWSNENPGLVPNPDNDLIAKFENHGYEFPDLAFQSKIFENRSIHSFSQLVIYFKKLFHIRSDNSLLKLIRNINLNEEWNNKIVFDDTEMTDNIEFFTDVDKLLQAYKRIIKIILQISEEFNLGLPQLRLSLYETEAGVMFSIHHINSTYKKTLRNTLGRIGKSHAELIRNQINGLCDLYIRADFGNNEFAKVNLWTNEDRKAEMLEKFTGVEYQLVFKQSQ